MKTNLSTSHNYGNQPIKVLLQKVINQFENTNPKFAKQSIKLVNDKLLNNGIAYHTVDISNEDQADGKIRTPFITDKGEINIHETFLSYVWCICYSILVLYDEGIAKVNQNRVSHSTLHQIDHHKIDIALSLFDYAKSLISIFSHWDEKLPQPKEHTQGLDNFIDKASTLFIFAMNFILCHEFVHAEKKHFKQRLQGKNTTEDRLRYEREADSCAMEYILSTKTNSKERVEKEIGILMGLCSLLFFNKESKTTTHPATDDRIHELLLKTEPPDTSYHWGIAVVAFRLWDNQFDIHFDWPVEVETVKDLYDLIRNQIKEKYTN